MVLSAEELKGVLGDLELNEEAIPALQTLIDNALNEKISASVTDAEAVLKETHAQEIAALNESINQKVEEAKAEITGKVEGYTAFAMKQYIAENEEKFKRLETLERIEESFKAIKTAFESNGFQVNPTSIEGELTTKLDESKTALDSAVLALNEANQKVRKLETELIFESTTKSLADTQREKVRTLMESVAFENVDEFTKGLEILVEQVVSVKPAEPVPAPLNEEVSPEKKAAQERMNKYLAAARGGYVPTK